MRNETIMKVVLKRKRSPNATIPPPGWKPDSYPHFTNGFCEAVSQAEAHGESLTISAISIRTISGPKKKWVKVRPLFPGLRWFSLVLPVSLATSEPCCPPLVVRSAELLLVRTQPAPEPSSLVQGVDGDAPKTQERHAGIVCPHPNKGGEQGERMPSLPEERHEGEHGAGGVSRRQKPCP